LTDTNTKPGRRIGHNSGCFGGSSVGFFEHEVANWIRSRLRAGAGPAMPPLPTPDCPTIISVAEVCRRTGFSRIHVWRLEQQGRFPRRIRLEAGHADAAD
jgi:predicted DNA-binding transcriptional regulator AlpA